MSEQREKAGGHKPLFWTVLHSSGESMFFR